MSVSEDLAQFARLAFPYLVDCKIQNMDVPTIFVAKRGGELLIGLSVEVQSPIVGALADLEPCKELQLIFIQEPTTP